LRPGLRACARSGYSLHEDDITVVSGYIHRNRIAMLLILLTPGFR
jgi:hypothetical protein